MASPLRALCRPVRRAGPVRRGRSSLSLNGPGRSGRTEAVPHARLLVADDHADTREWLHTILTTAGYEVLLAEDGQAALERYRQRPAEIVLMDLVMPRKDGITAIRELCEEFPGVTTVAMSGDSGTVWHDALAEARIAGARLTLRKPLEPWVLLRTVEGLLAARKRLAVGQLDRSA
jgi:two-component system chemotaxis response regulator CheY